MKRVHRFQNSGDVKLLLRRGRRYESPFFRIYVLRNRRLGARFAFITPRSIEKRATVRNRLRRRAREWIRRYSGLLHRSLDLAILFKKTATTSSREKLYEELASTIKKVVF